MSNKICPKCNFEFKFPSMLRTHFKRSFHCLSTEEEIYNFFNNNNNNNLNKCLKCSNKFVNLQAYKRHVKETKCGKSQTQIQPLQTQPPPTQSTSIQTINSNNSNSYNNTININNNNNTIIQHINPFGLEDVRTIPIPEMITILSSGDKAGFNIIKAIYSKLENKNFYKPNISRPEIAFLNLDFNLTIYNNKEFCDALFDRCIALLHHMLYLCKQQLSVISIKHIYANIEYIENTMRTEIYEQKLKNIIESEFRNNNINTKDKIKKFIYEVKNNIYVKEISQSVKDNTLLLEDNSNNEYTKTITNNELNKLFGDPNQILETIKHIIMQDFLSSRYEDSVFYKFWCNRINLEYEYLNNNKNAVIGDINYIKTRHLQFQKMLNIIKQKADDLILGQTFDLEINNFIRD